MEGNYNPQKLKAAYGRLGHGKAKADAMRYAIQQADLNNDIPYMVFFRQEFCNEAMWYADEIDIYTVFPELLSLIDRYPDTEPVLPNNDINDIMEDILYIYGSMVVDSSDYYQIPFKECERLFDDYTKRMTSAGYSASLPYRYRAAFYTETGHSAKAAEYFNAYKKCPADPDECPGCLTTSEIHYYLFNNMKEKADQLAAKIEDGTIACREDAANKSFSLLRLKINYVEYYIMHGDYERAAECSDVLRCKNRQEREFVAPDFEMCSYVYKNPGHGMNLYRNHWHEWEKDRDPYDKFISFMCAACFFKGIKKQRDKDTVKIYADNSFPLYNGSNVYKLDSLIEYYYNGAKEIAGKFDNRNGTSKFIDELNMSFKNVL